MKLAAVIDINRNYKEFGLKENTHISLIKKTEDVFYVEPRYKSIKTVNDAKFVLFSAPGASGKSTLLQAMRKHKKDNMAKDIEFIDNRIVGNNKQRMKYRNLMLEKHIIYIDADESHLYKLDADKLGEYGLSWVEVSKMDSGKFKRLYDDFCMWVAGN